MAKGEGKGGCGDCGISCMKYMLFFFNILFWLAGLAIIAIGIWARVDPNFEKKLGAGSDSLQYLHTGAYVLIGIGAFIALVGFLGCCGAIKESQCMLATFFVILLLLFCALLACGIWAIIKKNDIKDTIGDFISDQIKKAKGGDQSAKDNIESIQLALECCGRTSKADWGTTSTKCKSGTELTGCETKVWNFLESHALILGGVAIGIAVIMLLGMIFSMCLCCAISRGKDY